MVEEKETKEKVEEKTRNGLIKKLGMGLLLTGALSFMSYSIYSKIVYGTKEEKESYIRDFERRDLNNDSVLTLDEYLPRKYR